MGCDSTNGRRTIFVCLNEDCCRRGSETVFDDLKRACAHLEDVQVKEYICFGNCEFGVNTVVLPDRVWFSGLKAAGASTVLDYVTKGVVSTEHIGQVDEELAETTWELLELEEEEDDAVEPLRGSVETG